MLEMRPARAGASFRSQKNPRGEALTFETFATHAVRAWASLTRDFLYLYRTQKLIPNSV